MMERFKGSSEAWLTMAAPLLYCIWSWQRNNSINYGHSYLLVAGKTTGLNSFGLMWCNGTTAAPKIALFVQFCWHAPMDIICMSTGWILCWEYLILLERRNSWYLYEWESWLHVPIFLRQLMNWWNIVIIFRHHMWTSVVHMDICEWWAWQGSPLWIPPRSGLPGTNIVCLKKAFLKILFWLGLNL